MGRHNDKGLVIKLPGGGSFAVRYGPSGANVSVSAFGVTIGSDSEATTARLPRARFKPRPIYQALPLKGYELAYAND